MTVPYTFGNATTSIPLSNLDADFATPITLGNTNVYLGNTTTNINNLSLGNVSITSVGSTFPNSYLSNSSATLGNAVVTLGGTTTSVGNLTLTNVTISSVASTLPNSYLANSSVTINGTSVALGGSATITANAAATLTISTGLSGTSYNGGTAVTIAIDSTVATLTGVQTLTNKTINGSNNTLSNIPNSALTNNTVTVNGTSIALGASGTVTAAAGTLTGTTLNSTVVTSSLTAVGTITTGVWNGTAIGNTYLANSTISGVSLGSNLANLTAGTNISFSSGTTYNGSSAITINATASPQVYPGAGIANSTGTAWGTSYSTTGSGTVVALATSPTFVTPILGTPTSGTLTNTTGFPAANLAGTALPSAIVTSSLTAVGTIATGTWNGSIITGTYGGTGVNNGSNTITIAGNLTHAGAFTQSFTATANTAVTLPAGATASSNNLLSSATAVGIVTGTPSITTYLRGDGTWATVSGGVSSFSAGTTGFTPSTATTGAVTLAGTLAVANGGTGQTTASAGFNALSPITTTGDLIIGNGTNSATRLAIGANTYVLTSNGTTATWAASGSGGSGTVNSGTQYQLGYYASTGTAISGNSNIKTDANSNLNLAATGATLNSANTFGFKNRIINGGMTIDQRGSASSPVATGFGVDRFIYDKNGAGVVTFGQSTTAPTGFINSSLVTVTTADTSIANSDLYFIYQQIEGLNVADLGFGTAIAQTVTLSFWVRSSVTGTYGASISNFLGNRCYVSNYTINVANTWEQKSITVAGDTSGTWLTTNGIGFGIRWGLAAGSNYQQTANVWGTANAVCSSSQVNFMATVSNTFYITGVQLEIGTQATSFDFRDYGRELILCQRYFYKADSTTIPCFATTTGRALGTISFPTTMRTTPTSSGTDVTSMNNWYVANLTGVYSYETGGLTPNGNGVGFFVASGTNYTAGTIYRPNGAVGTFFISYTAEL